MADLSGGLFRKPDIVVETLKNTGTLDNAEWATVGGGNTLLPEALRLIVAGILAWTVDEIRSLRHLEITDLVRVRFSEIDAAISINHRACDALKTGRCGRHGKFRDGRRRKIANIPESIARLFGEDNSGLGIEADVDTEGMAVCCGHTVFCVICSENDRASRDDTTDRSNAANLVGIVFGEPEVVRPEEDKTGGLTGGRRSR